MTINTWNPEVTNKIYVTTKNIKVCSVIGGQMQDTLIRFQLFQKHFMCKLCIFTFFKLFYKMVLYFSQNFWLQVSMYSGDEIKYVPTILSIYGRTQKGSVSNYISSFSS